MNQTSIEWTDYTANPLKFRAPDGRVVWHCEKLSPGCKNCYAEALSHRYGARRRAGEWNAATTATLTPFLDEAELRHMLTAKAIAGKRVFIGDMTDVFGEWVPDDLLDQMFGAFALRPDVTWQVLTKRAERARSYLSHGSERVADAIGFGHGALASVESRFRNEVSNCILGHGGAGYPHQPLWPLPNVWLGVSAENQEQADTRIPSLLQTPARVRFVSAEPLLGPINFESIQLPAPGAETYGLRGVLAPRSLKETEPDDWKYWTRVGARLSWVIVGGESGPHWQDARRCEVAWVRSIVEQCRLAEVPVFVKQLGSHVGDIAVCPFDDQGPEPVRRLLKDRKGGNPSEWPEDIRVRQFPESAVPA